MNDRGKISVLILEKDPSVVAAVKKEFPKESYEPTPAPDSEEAIALLRSGAYSLAVVGDTEALESPFAALHQVVMAAPMTSVILLSDLPEREVHEKAEGYGILGSVARNIPPREFGQLLSRFEQISNSLRDHELK